LNTLFDQEELSSSKSKIQELLSRNNILDSQLRQMNTDVFDNLKLDELSVLNQLIAE